MNSKIKELAERADCTIDGLGYGEGNIEKFAQLIIQKCGQYLDSPEFIGRSDLDWSMVLNEYFGIKNKRKD